MTTSAPAARAAPERASAQEPVPHRHPAFRGVLGAGLLILAGFPLWWPPLEGTLLALEQGLTALIPADVAGRIQWIALPVLGPAGGLLASVSPCVLPLLPLNAAYIGATGVPTARAASVSARFVLGAVLALSVLGLFADLAGAVFIDYRGPLRVGVGLILLALGAVQAELLSLPSLPALGATRSLGPVAAGATFALITTPCASPILFAVLAAAGAQTVPGLAVVTMAAFAFGYTALVFVAGILGGRALARFRRHSLAIQSGAAAFLILAGLGFAASGALWFF